MRFIATSALKITLVCTVALATMNVSAKELGGFTAPDKSFELKVETGSDATRSIELNKLTSLTATVIPKDATALANFLELQFDAVMPAHNHGMIVKPVVKMVSPGVFRIDGVKLHMAGEWQLLFTVKEKQNSTKISVPFHL